MAKRRIEVNTNNYYWAHGKNPRGYGRWMFEVISDGNGTETVAHTGTYSEAKAEAMKVARKMEAMYITVMS